jgi:hypothetical protein
MAADAVGEHGGFKRKTCDWLNRLEVRRIKLKSPCVLTNSALYCSRYLRTTSQHEDPAEGLALSGGDRSAVSAMPFPACGRHKLPTKVVLIEVIDRVLQRSNLGTFRALP